MMNKEVFLDLDNPNLEHMTDEEVGKNELSSYYEEDYVKSVGKRKKELSDQMILQNTRSSKFYSRAKRFYILGFFEESIIICRAAAEYIVCEIFEEKIVNSNGENGLSFRKKLDFLNGKKSIIEEQLGVDLHRLYDIGNACIHYRKEIKTKEEIEKEAKEAIEFLKKAIKNLRNILTEYEIVNGSLSKKY